MLEKALPLLAKLRRPQLLLEERRLQAVLKAQRLSVETRGYEPGSPFGRLRARVMQFFGELIFFVVNKRNP